MAELVQSNCYYLPPYGTLGNVGRDSLIGPGFMDLDFSVMKETKLTEKVNLGLRAEFFNIVNHTSFGNPSPGFYLRRRCDWLAGRISRDAFDDSL